MSKLRFTVMVDAGHPDEPPPRHFGSRQAALRAYGEIEDKWRPFVWITEELDNGTISVIMRDGQQRSPNVSPL